MCLLQSSMFLYCLSVSLLHLEIAGLSRLLFQQRDFTSYVLSMAWIKFLSGVFLSEIFLSFFLIVWGERKGKGKKRGGGVLIILGREKKTCVSFLSFFLWQKRLLTNLGLRRKKKGFCITCFFFFFFFLSFLLFFLLFYHCTVHVTF